MDDGDNRRYYTARAEAARRLADRAASPYIAAAHNELARLYETVAQCSARLDAADRPSSDGLARATMKVILVEPRHGS